MQHHFGLTRNHHPQTWRLGCPRWHQHCLILLAGSVVFATMPLPAQALNIGGGTATQDSPQNNTNLDPATGKAVFGWDYVGRANWNAVYLGNGWVLTAAHVGQSSTIDLGTQGVYNTISGSSVQIYNPTVIGDTYSGTATDLILYRIAPNATTGQLPNLAPLVLPTTTPSNNTQVTMVSAGPWVARPTYYNYNSSTGTWSVAADYQSGTFAGLDYSAQAPNFTGVKRWGYNTLSNNAVIYENGSGKVHALSTKFYDPGKDPIGGITNESALSNGDSGGGLFGSSESVGLLGILDVKYEFNNQPNYTTIYGSESGAVNVAWYAANLASTMGIYQFTSITNKNWSSSSWNNFQNSSATPGPNAAGTTVNLLATNPNPLTITLTTSPTVGTLNFNSTKTYTLNTVTAQTLTFDNSSSGATLANWEGTHTINPSIILNDNLTVNVKTAGDLLTLKAVSSSTNKSLTKIGNGNLTTTGTISGLSSVVNNGVGVFTISGNITSTIAVSNTSTGSMVLSGTNSYTGGTLVSQGQLTFTSAAARPANDLLTINKSGSPIQGGMVVINAASANINAYQAQLLNGLNPSPIGPAIKTTMGIGTEGIGYLTGSDYNSLHGTSLDPTSIVFKYSYLGDIDLDGKITGVDFAQIDAAYLSGAYSTPGGNPHWINGDLNYDGLVNAQDFALITAAFAAQGSNPIVLASLVSQDTARFGSDFLTAYHQALATVPEPTSLGLLLLGSLGLRQRRRHKS